MYLDARGLLVWHIGDGTVIYEQTTDEDVDSDDVASTGDNSIDDHANVYYEADDKASVGNSDDVASTGGNSSNDHTDVYYDADDEASAGNDDDEA